MSKILKEVTNSREMEEETQHEKETNIDPGIRGNPEGVSTLEYMLPQDNFTKEDAMKNCGTWVDTQQQLQKTKRKKNVVEVEDEEDCDSPDENDASGSLATSTPSTNSRRKAKLPKLKDERLDLLCEWRGCNYRSSVLNMFLHHVSYHIPELDVKVNNDDEEVYVCLWEACGFETSDRKEITRHVNFHSYHTKIKCIGSNMVSKMKLPSCTYDEDGRNLLPDLPDIFLCNWEDCGCDFNNSHKYFEHVRSHAMNNQRGRHITSGVSCCWRGCKAVFRTAYKLSDHMHTHTQEKVIGCPTCGGLFASRTKFFDHCKRQTPEEYKGYQCTHCSKYFPSERLLRDHMRHHVNHYKCTFCDMTCPTPSSLSVHIRYRHLDSKPFKCDFCEYTAKTQHDMNYHINTHCPDPLFRCEQDDCHFSCRSAYGLSRHYHKHHNSNGEPMYSCHICQERFHRGSILTRHLFIKHSFRWPSGHCRFRYKCDEDGLFRLQTVRYESLEVTQEMMQSESGSFQQTMFGSRRYNLRRRNRKNEVEFTLSEDEEEDDHLEQPPRSGRILISIEELDSCGNVVRSKVMEADEVPSIPMGQVTLIQDGGQVK